MCGKMAGTGSHMVLVFLAVLVLAPLARAAGDEATAELRRTYEHRQVPLFAELSPKSRVVGVLDVRSARILESRPRHLLREPAMRGPWSPVRYVRDCYRVQQGTVVGWIVDGVVIRNGSLTAEFGIDWTLVPWACASLMGALLCVAMSWWRGRGTRREPAAAWFDLRGNTAKALLALLLVRGAILLGTLALTSPFALCTTDEEGYFAVGQAIVRTWDFSTCRYPVGWGAVHGLFALLQGTTDYGAVLLPISYCNSLLIGSAICVVLFAVAHGLTGSRGRSLLAVALFVATPYVVHVLHRDNTVTRDFIGMVATSEYAVRIYYWGTMVGHNAFSDHPTVLVLLCVAWCALHFFPLTGDGVIGRRAWLGAGLVGVLFGLAGTVRVPSILFLPVPLVLLGRAPRRCAVLEAVRSRTAVLLAFGVGCLVGYSPQMVANVLQSGSPWTLPYHLFHPPRAHNGFDWTFVLTGGPFVLGALSIPLSLAAVTFSGTGPVRTKLLLWLAIYPVVLFFSGYPCVTQDAVRWYLPIYPFLLTGLATCRREEWAAFACFGALTAGLKDPGGRLAWRDGLYVGVLTVAGALGTLAMRFAAPPRRPRLARATGAFALVSLSEALILSTRLSAWLFPLHTLLVLACIGRQWLGSRRTFPTSEVR